MGDWGIKVSKPTKSITSSTPEDYVFNSKYGSTIIFRDNEVSVNIAANDETESTVSYGVDFGYYPVVLIYAELVPGSGEWYLTPFTMYEEIDTYVSAVIYSLGWSSVGTSSFTLYFHNRTGSPITVKYHYYIFANLG